MPFDRNGDWQPPLSRKQNELRDVCHEKRYVLAVGPRLSTKTFGACHCFVEHAYETPRGNSCIITISQSVGLDSGVWKDLVDVVIPQWVYADGDDFGFRWVRMPYTMGVSKRPTCEITNHLSATVEDLDLENGEGIDRDMKPENRRKLRAAKATSVIQLESLKDESEYEKRFKGRRYSCIYVPELSNFKNRATFTNWTECLRHLGLEYEKHLLLLDTNPSDEGEGSWIFKLWYELLDADEAKVAPEELALRDQLGRVDFTIADNIFDSPERIAELKAKYFHDPDLFARYIEGKWVTATEDAIFAATFRPKFHVFGEKTSRANPDPEILFPEENCSALGTGSDPGDTMNSASVVVEKAHRIEQIQLPTGVVIERQKTVFKVLDEVVIVGTLHRTEDYILELMRRMAFWEEQIGQVGTTRWQHWSDRSVFERLSQETQRYLHQIIYDYSYHAIEDGEVFITEPIVLDAADRGHGSVFQRVDLTRKLLFENRLFISAERCPKLTEMFKAIRRGTHTGQTIEKNSRHKHVFDALSYYLASECRDELVAAVYQNMAATRRKKRHGEGLVAVAL